MIGEAHSLRKRIMADSELESTFNFMSLLEEHGLQVYETHMAGLGATTLVHMSHLTLEDTEDFEPALMDDQREAFLAMVSSACARLGSPSAARPSLARDSRSVPEQCQMASHAGFTGVAAPGFRCAKSTIAAARACSGRIFELESPAGAIFPQASYTVS